MKFETQSKTKKIFALAMVSAVCISVVEVKAQCLWSKYAFYSWQFKTGQKSTKRLATIEPGQDSLIIHVYSYKVIDGDTILNLKKLDRYTGKSVCKDQIGKISAKNNLNKKSLSLKISFAGKIYTDIVSGTPFILADTNELRMVLNR